MSTPTTFPSGIGTYPPAHIIRDYPVVPTPWQITKTEDFLPFRSGDYTSTAGGTAAAVAAFPLNGGAIKLTGGSTTPFDQFLAMPSNWMELIPGNKMWHEVQLAIPTGAQTNPSTDADVYVGIFDTASPLTAANGLYFIKPSGGTAVHFVVLKAGTATTFQNVADLAKPSGLFNNPQDIAGVLTANATGTTLTSIVVTNPGFGYRIAPLVLVNGTGGTLAAASVALGGAAGNQVIGFQGYGSSLYSPIIQAAGSGYTAGTFTLDVLPVHSLQFRYSGNGQLRVGINGITTLALETNGQGTVVPGTTVNTQTVGNQFNFLGTTISTGIMPVQPNAGDPILAMPLVTMAPAFGIRGTTANNRVVYVMEANWAVENN